MDRALALCCLTLLLSPAAAAQEVSEVGRLQVLPGYVMRAPTVVWDGARYLVFFESHPDQQPGETDLYLARIAPDGTLETGDVRPLGLGGATLPGSPRAAFNPTSGRTLLAWVARDGVLSDLAATTLDFDDAPSAVTALTQTAAVELRPTVAANPYGFLVGWAAGVPNGGSVVSGRRLTAEGQLIDPAPVSIRETSTAFENRPFVLGTERGYLFLWDEADADVDGFITTVTSSAAFRAGPVLRLAAGAQRQSGLTAAPLGPRFYAVWQDFRRGDLPDAWGARLQADLQLDRTPEIVTQVDGRTNGPVIAGDANGALVVWQSLRTGRTRGEIRAGRIDTAGRILEYPGFSVISVDENVYEHAVAKGPDDQYLVVAIEDTVLPRIVYALVESGLSAVEEPPPDAGVPEDDAGTPPRDSGSRDAAPVDAGVADAGIQAASDAGFPASGASDEGCQSTPGTPGALVLVGLWALIRRRRG